MRQLYLRLPCSILLSPSAIPYGWGIKINYPHFDVALKKTMVPVRQTISVPLPPSPAPSRMAMTYFYLPRRSLFRSPFDGVILQRDSTVFPLVTFLCVCVCFCCCCFDLFFGSHSTAKHRQEQPQAADPNPPNPTSFAKKADLTYAARKNWSFWGVGGGAGKRK